MTLVPRLPEVTSQPEVIVSPEVTSQPEVTPPDPGSDITTGSDSPRLPEVASRPEVTPRLPEVPARPEVKKCALLHNGITGLYICVGCCTLTLVVLLWGDFNQRMRVE